MTNLLILTCRRRALVESGADPWKYLRDTIAQIVAEDAPLNAAGVVCDGSYEGGPDLPDGWTLYEFDRETCDTPTNIRGNKWSYWHLLNIGRLLGGDLIALEDDLWFSTNAVRRMMAFPIPLDLAWVQFFSPRILVAPDSPPGLWRPPGGTSLFLQAAKYSAPALAQLIDFKRHPLWTQWKESDTCLATAEHELGLRYGVHSPDLVQHRGDLSEANPLDKLNPWRKSACWLGSEFDALELFRRDDVYR